MPPVILASSSPARQTLFARLGLPFTACSPAIDESRRDGETPRELVLRLAQQKAAAVAAPLASGLVIGSDQVAAVDGTILTKPGDHERATQQLRQCSGRRVTFYTGLCVLNAATQRRQADVDTFSVVFRQLSDRQIDHYLRREQPYQCAGSIKVESLGIALFRAMEGNDINTLIGLPLIRLIDMLHQEGIDVLSF